MRKTLAVGRKEFRQIARDRRSLMVLLFVPAFFLLLYGYALSFDVSNIQLAVHGQRSHVGQPRSGECVRPVRLFSAGRNVSNSREYEALIDSGEVRAVLVIPEAFRRTFSRGGACRFR